MNLATAPKRPPVRRRQGAMPWTPSAARCSALARRRLTSLPVRSAGEMALADLHRSSAAAGAGSPARVGRTYFDPKPSLRRDSMPGPTVISHTRTRCAGDNA